MEPDVRPAIATDAKFTRVGTERRALNVVSLHDQMLHTILRDPAPRGEGPTRNLRRALVAVDATAVAASWALVLALAGHFDPPARLPVVAALTAVTLALLQMHQLYLARICHVRAVELSRLARVSALVGLSGYLVAGRVPSGIGVASIVEGALTSFVALAIGRSGYASWLKHLRARGEACRPVIVVGENEEGKALQRLLETHPELGLIVAEVVSRVDDVSAALSRCGANSVLIAVSAVSATDLNGLTRRLLDDGVHVHLSCGLAGVDHRRLRQMPLAHEPLFYVERVTVSKTQAGLSRALDIFGSVVGLVLTLPVIAVAAVAIKLHDGGPVFFRHERVGRLGRPFMLYKLRTMVPDAESRLSSVQASNFRDGPLFKSADDSRVTRVGRVLRATSIDELPQLLNVLMGAMSLVGPRPALPREVESFDAELLNRLRVKPGITGLWQVEARHDPSFESYRKLDLFYIENWSLELDLVILVATAKSLLGQAVRDLRKQRVAAPLVTAPR